MTQGCATCSAETTRKSVASAVPTAPPLERQLLAAIAIGVGSCDSVTRAPGVTGRRSGYRHHWGQAGSPVTSPGGDPIVQRSLWWCGKLWNPAISIPS